MMLLRASGLTRIDQVDEEARERLVMEAERFLLGGGGVSIADWSVLEPIERDALVEAGLRVRLARMIEREVEA